MDQNEIFTILQILQEVNQRYLSLLIGNSSIKRKLKQNFSRYINFGDQFRNEWIAELTKALKIEHSKNGNSSEEAEKGVAECLEYHEQDSDFIFDLIKAGSKINTSEKQKEAIKLLESI